MSDWTPKVGDRVMVGEHGPYRVAWLNQHGTFCDLRDDENQRYVGEVLLELLTPEPEPEEPTAPGALVRDGDGRVRSLNHTINRGAMWYKVDDRDDTAALALGWRNLPRPVTVILADPAEVETLRAEVESLTELLTTPMPSRERLEAERDRAQEAASQATVNADRFAAERDELQRRIDLLIAGGPGWIMQHGSAVMCILLGDDKP